MDAALMSNLDDAQKALDLNPQERALYERHLTNLRKGPVENADGSRSTLYAMTTEVDGKTYVVPTVWGGKILEPDEAMKKAEEAGLGSFPSYPTAEEADARYKAMHDFIEKDTKETLAKEDDFDARSLFPNSNMAP